MNDAQRLNSLRQYVVSQYNLIRSNTVSHGQALVNIAGFAEHLNSGQATSYAQTARLAVNDMARVIIGDNVRRPGVGEYFAGWGPRGASGFLTGYQDDSQQIVHATAGLYLSVNFGRGGEAAAIAREIYTNVDRGSLEWADYSLFAATFTVSEFIDVAADKNAFGVGAPSVLVRGITEIITDKSVSKPTLLSYPPTDIPIKDWCFAAGTQILMADGSQKPIEKIEVGDWVGSFDPEDLSGRSQLKQARVTKTFVNRNQEVIDLHGVKVTPGHRFLSGDGSFRVIQEILDMDGSIIGEDGTEIRARTGLPVGSLEDRIIPVGYEDVIGEIRIAYMRAGTPCALKEGELGKVYTLLSMMADMGYDLGDEGKFHKDGSPAITAFWQWGTPDEEDVVIGYLDRSISEGEDQVFQSDPNQSTYSTEPLPQNRRSRRRRNAQIRRGEVLSTTRASESVPRYGIFCGF